MDYFFSIKVLARIKWFSNLQEWQSLSKSFGAFGTLYIQIKSWKPNKKNDNYLLSTYYVPSTLSAAQVVKTPKEKKKEKKIFKPEEKKKGSLRVREHAEIAVRENWRWGCFGSVCERTQISVLSCACVE